MFLRHHEQAEPPEAAPEPRVGRPSDERNGEQQPDDHRGHPQEQRPRYRVGGDGQEHAERGVPRIAARDLRPGQGAVVAPLRLPAASRPSRIEITALDWFSMVTGAISPATTVSTSRLTKRGSRRRIRAAPRGPQRAPR